MSNNLADLHADYQADLPAEQVHSRLVSALDQLHRAEQNAVLWFAEIMGRDLYRPLGFSSLQQYATEALGFSQSKTYQFIRLADALKKLPQLHQSVAEGEIGWTKAREVARVATPKTQERWIREAKNSSNRQLEQKVFAAKQRARNARRSNPDQQELAVPTVTETSVEVPVTLTLRFTPEQLARYEALLDQIGKASSRSDKRGENGAGGRRPLSREERHLAALEDHLAALRESPDCTRVQSSPPYQIIIYRCDDCGRGTIRARHGTRELSPAALQAAACDSRVLSMGESETPATGKQGEATSTGQQNRASIPPGVRRRVLARDGHRCRMKGCGQTRFLEVHHLVPRTVGGKNVQDNLVTLCASCHRLLHERFLKGYSRQEEFLAEDLLGTSTACK